MSPVLDRTIAYYKESMYRRLTDKSFFQDKDQKESLVLSFVLNNGVQIFLDLWYVFRVKCEIGIEKGGAL